MVRRLVIILLALLTGGAFADAIFWMVSSDMLPGNSFSAARVMVSPADGEDHVLSTVYYEEETGGYTGVYEPGVGLVSDENDPPSTGWMWASIDVDDPTTAMFYIELGNYEMTENGPIWTQTVATGQSRSYNWLVGNGSIGTPGDFSNVYEPWNGMTYSVPEPTSGLLALIGFAALALRRKRPGGRRWGC